MSNTIENTWIPGDYYQICDECGFKYRKSQMQKRWDGLWVCEKDFELRQPQDFVKGRADKQSVPYPRPDNNNITRTTTLAVAASKGATSISVASASYLDDGYSIGIALDDDTIQWTLVNGDLVGVVVTLLEPLSGAAALGNTVYVPGSTFRFTEITGSDL